MRQSRYEGWLAGVGVSYGYRWSFSHLWGLEAAVGVGYACLDYDKYACYKCGERLTSRSRNYFGPTKAGVSLTYAIGGKRRSARRTALVYVLPVMAETTADGSAR